MVSASGSASRGQNSNSPTNSPTRRGTVLMAVVVMLVVQGLVVDGGIHPSIPSTPTVVAYADGSRLKCAPTLRLTCCWRSSDDLDRFRIQDRMVRASPV